MTTVANAAAGTSMSITSCGLVSPVGNDLVALGAGLRGLVSACGEADHLGEELLPPRAIRVAADLPVTELLGRKGTGHLDRTTKLGLIACRLALGELPGARDEQFLRRTGVVMATSTGSIRSTTEFSRETLVQDRPYLVNPRLFPNSVMNCCAGQVAIWNRLRGVNATLAGGPVSMLHALRYAANAVHGGHVDRVLVGAVEELSAQSAWAWHLTRALAKDAPVGEGCGVFMVERTADLPAVGRAPLVDILACEIGTFAPLSNREGLVAGIAECIGRALSRADVAPDEITAVSVGATNQRGLSRVEQEGIRRGLGRLPSRIVEVKRIVGECFSANGAMQIAALLADTDALGSRQTAASVGELALVTSVGFDGAVGCMLLRRPAAQS
jgi:3-oxoacyl-[acyl-carrier-protein] synthase II